LIATTITAEAKIIYCRDVIPKLTQHKLLEYFKTVEWFTGDYKGRTVSRLQRWYHMEDRRISDKWPEFVRWMPCKYTTLLHNVQESVARYVKTAAAIATSEHDLNSLAHLNSVLINFYPNGSCIIPKHRDSEELFGENPIILIISLGCTRTMRFSKINPQSKSLKAENYYDIDLEPGSLLIMSGTTQKHYCHELLKSDTCTSERYSMTFRYHP